ncbi:hypothetical protein BLA24_15950 [Streptomyces cinnamoneus]|uniref:Nucleic acid/nucleotide deaminase of polymorphic system toxin n=1 Tax=Streptomyces cinnamoneus TaxID=53446 RepID=A0A2G1XJ15_STRCJ|nr:SUKH-4 family immunity protein [Streptomyces cinnamoneus]PHQ51244.1 hypothetical protein BLA24_15950 [Streptomyces cinnamoneus]PPT13531.1 hypothetical protein CYQ11_12125 [Streptomyces cinnamoneus]
MVTFAQAQERAERWVNADVPAYLQREVRVREFDLGFVCWAEDRENGPTGDGGRVRLVIARDSGETTLWPGLPVGEVIRRYEEEYAAVDEPEPAVADEPPRRVDLNQTSFLLSPPQWLQDAADAMGIPDRRQEPDTAPTPTPAPAPAPEPEDAPAAPAESPDTAAAAAPAAPAPATPAPAASAPAVPSAEPAPEPPAGPWAGADVADPAADADAVPSPEPWAGADVSADDDHAVGLPATVLAPALSGSDLDDTPPPGVRPDAKTTLMPQGSALPRTTIAPALEDPAAPGASQGGYVRTRMVSQLDEASLGAGVPPAPATPPGAPGQSAPGGPGAQHPAPGMPPAGPGGPAAPGVPPAPGAPAAPGVPPAGPGAPAAPGVPPVPGAPAAPGVPPAPGAPGMPGAPGQPGATGAPGVPGAPGAGVPHAPGAPGAPGQPGVPAGPGAVGPGVPPAPGTPGAPGQPPVPGAPGAPAAPQAPGHPGVPAAPGTPPGGVHAAATMLASPGAPGAPQAPGVPHAPGAPGAPGQPPVPGAPGAPAAPQAPGHPGAPAAPGTPPGGVHAAATMLASPGAPAPVGPPPGAPQGYGYPPAAPTGVPTVGPGYMAVLRYRAQDGSEQQIIRRSAPGTPHPEWQILHELRAMNVPPQQVLELHTELESCDLPGGYCARMIRETWPQVRISHTAGYGRDHATRQQGVRHLVEHQGELHQVADGPARPAPNRVPVPHPSQVRPAPPVGPDVVGRELAEAFGPQGVFRFDQRAVSRQGVPDVVAQTLVWAGLPADFGPFFWGQTQPGRPVPTLAELAAERGVRPAADAGSYLVMGSDYGRQLCVQYGTAHIVAVPLEAGPDGQPVPPQFVNTSLPQFVRSLALLGKMWRWRYGLTPEQAGRWTVDFQEQLAALDPAALSSPENWWAVLLEQMWDGLF